MTSNGTGDDKDIDDLVQAMNAVIPAPDPAVRRAHIDLAESTFNDLHTARGPAKSSQKGLLSGLLSRFSTLGSAGGLGATTAVLAGGFVLLSPVGQDLWRTDTLLGEPEAAVEPVVQETPEEPDTLRDQTGETLLDTLSAPQTDDRIAAGVLEPLASVEETEASAVDADISGSASLEDAPAGASLTNRLQLPEETADLGVATDTPLPGDMSAEPFAEESGLQADQRLPPEAPMEIDGAVLEQQDAPSPAAQASEIMGGLEAGVETFSNDRPSDVIITADEPVSTFSIDVDTASYAIIRQSIFSGVLPPRDAVRIEEMVNYFTYDYAAPDRDSTRPFEPTVSVIQTPWNEDTQLVHIGLQGIMPDLDERPPLNLVFLIDTSGSMEDDDKLPLLIQSFRLMLNELRPEDEVAIVTYAGSAGLALPATPASDRATISAALNQLDAGGSTNGVGGLQQAYDVAATMTADGEVSRVILATDGDFNVGISDPSALTDYIADQRDTGVFLNVLGFGRGNLDDATMQALAQNGNGMAAYIDTLGEAQKVLVDQVTGALFAIAADVKVQVEWNPGMIGEYRLIGYETRALAREDFNNDRVDAGELGAGHTVTAIYEVTPVGSPALLNDPLRYQPAEVTAAGTEMGFLRLRWKQPGEDESQLYEVAIMAADPLEQNPEAQFAAAIAGFGQLLRDDRYLGDWGWDDAIALASASRGDDPFAYRFEAIRMMQLAQSLSEGAVSQD